MRKNQKKSGGGGQQIKKATGEHKPNMAAQRKRAIYKTLGRAVRNKRCRLIRDTKMKSPEAAKKRELKKVAAALKPENCERRRESKELRKKRQAARRGNLKILKELENADVPVWDIKSEAHLSAEALKGGKSSLNALGILKECYPETFKAVTKMIAAQKTAEVETKKILAEADVVINDIKAEAERRALTDVVH